MWLSTGVLGTSAEYRSEGNIYGLRWLYHCTDVFSQRWSMNAVLELTQLVAAQREHSIALPTPLRVAAWGRLMLCKYITNYSNPKNFWLSQNPTLL